MPVRFSLGLLATLCSLLALGCGTDEAADVPPPPADVPLLTDADAVLDSLVARWDAATAGVAGFSLATDAVVARYARQPDGAFVLADARVRDDQAAPPPLQFLWPDPARVAELLRGQATLYLDRSTAPPRYRLVADSSALAAAAAQAPDPAASSPYAAPVAASALVEAGTYRLREVHTRSPLPGSTVDSALVDLRIGYDGYDAVEGLLVPRTVTVTASGLLDTFGEGELMFMRAQYQQRLSRAATLSGDARAAEEAQLADLKALLMDGVSAEQMVVDSVAVELSD